MFSVLPTVTSMQHSKHITGRMDQEHIALQLVCHTKFLYYGPLVFLIWNMLSISITWYWLWLLLYDFFSFLFFRRNRKKISLQNKLGRAVFFFIIMNRCNIRLADKTHSKTRERFYYFLIENKIMNLNSFICL